MAVWEEPFIHVAPGKPKRPYLLVRYTNPHTGATVRNYSLIDTGADDCCLPASFAKILGHDLSKGEPVEVNAAGGPTTAYRHTMLLEIPGFSPDQTMISFMPELHVPLLGVHSFLYHFKICIDYPNERLTLYR